MKIHWPLGDRSFWEINVFDLENFNNYVAVDSIDQCDVAFIGPGTGREINHYQPLDQWQNLKIPGNVKLAVVDDLSHAYEHQGRQFLSMFSLLAQKNPHTHIVYISSFDRLCTDIDFSIPQNLSIVNYDFLFNRTKAYYLHHPYRAILTESGSPWYHEGAYSYQLTLDNRYRSITHQRIFLSCGRLRPHRSIYRHKLLSFLEPYQQQGFHSITDIKDSADEIAARNSNTVLKSTQDDPLRNGKVVWNPVTGQTDFTNIESEYGVKGYSPPHDFYYNNSFLSLFTETIEYGETVFISEKTYDPLIHGHFILPFGTAGYLECLQKKGIQLPDFINYEYDQIPDDDQRWISYQNQVSTAVSKSVLWWKKKKEDYRDLLMHNQRLFWLKPYSTCTDSLRELLSAATT